MKRVLILLPADARDQANALAQQLDSAATDLFTVGLNATGRQDDPVAYYWTGLSVSDTIYGLLGKILQPTFPGSVFLDWDMDTQPDLPDKTLVAMGLKRIRG